jgi:hypothetical protein
VRERKPLVLWGGAGMRDILILNEIWARGKIYILIGTLFVEIFYLNLAPVRA